MPSNHTAIKHVLNAEEVTTIRRALLVGLTSFGEIERLRDAADGFEMAGVPVAEQLKATHPTGAPDTASDFAAALSFLEYPAAE
jgi:hypothetical protein